MKKSATLCLASVLLVLGGQQLLAEKNANAATSPAKSEGGIQVNNQTIPEDELRLLLADRQAAGTKMTPALTNALREQLIARQLFAEEARKLDLQKSADYQTRVRMVKEEMLARNYQDHYLKQHAPTEEQVKQAYETIKQRSGDKEYHLRQIFVASEEEAKKVVERLADNEDFAKVATSVSKDQASRDKGGDLGWLNGLALQPAIMTEISGLKKGEFTQKPVKMGDGWHILKVDEMRPFTMPTYDKLAPKLKQELSRRVLDKHLLELRKSAVVK